MISLRYALSTDNNKLDIFLLNTLILIFRITACVLENTSFSTTHSQKPIANGRQVHKGGKGRCKGWHVN